MKDVREGGDERSGETDKESVYAVACADLLRELAEIVSSADAVVLNSPLEPIVDRACLAVERMRVDDRLDCGEYATVVEALAEAEVLLEGSSPSLGGWIQPLQGARDQLTTLRELDCWLRSAQ